MKRDLKLFAVLLLIGYLCVVLYLTLVVSFTLSDASRLNLVPFATMTEDLDAGGRGFVFNFIGNILLFVPLGFLSPCLLSRSGRFFRVVVIGMALSLMVEVMQWIWGERIADVDDVILNTLGTAAGYLFWVVARWIFRRRSRDAESRRPIEWTRS